MPIACGGSPAHSQVSACARNATFLSARWIAPGCFGFAHVGFAHMNLVGGQAIDNFLFTRSDHGRLSAPPEGGTTNGGCANDTGVSV
jgi:hypothetical protein